MLIVLLWYALAAVGAVALITARLQNTPISVMAWMPVGGWLVGYGAGCVTAYGIWQTWPGIRKATAEDVVFIIAALTGSLLGAAIGGVLALVDFRRAASQRIRQPTRVIMLAFVIVVVVMECAGCLGAYQWLSYAK